MCWMIPLDAVGSWGGLRTVTLVTNGWMTEIPFSDIRPGDAVGLCGLNTGGNAGHIQLVDAYDPATGHITVWEQAGGVDGPRRNQYKRITSGYKAYRATTPSGGGGDDSMNQAQNDMLTFIFNQFTNAVIKGETTVGTAQQGGDGPLYYDPSTPVALNTQLRAIGENAESCSEDVELILTDEQLDALADKVVARLGVLQFHAEDPV
jgi:hypothetical protein